MSIFYTTYCDSENAMTVEHILELKMAHIIFQHTTDLKYV